MHGIRHKAALSLFAYNRRGEVASATIAGNAATYVYDGIGNSTASTWNGAATTYVANELNQYARITRPSERPESLWYDVDGNLEFVDGSSYDYDALSRLTVARTNGVFAAAYAYDHLSRRVRKSTRDGVHTYFYDGWKLVLELIEHNGVTDRIEYVWGKDISGTLDGAAGIGGLLYTKINGAIYVPQYDAYGNIIAYYDAAGNIVASYTYDAFGKTIASSGALADAFAFRYSTKYFDRETGLYYYGMRYYSPALRRWLTRDPIEEDGGVNLYAMCMNCAIMMYDEIGYEGMLSGALTYGHIKGRGRMDGDKQARRVWRLINQIREKKSANGKCLYDVEVCDLNLYSPLAIQSDAKTNRENIYVVAHGGIMVNGVLNKYDKYRWSYFGSDSAYEVIVPSVNVKPVPLSFYGDLNPDNVFGCFISKRVRKYRVGLFFVYSSVDQYPLMFNALYGRLSRYLRSSSKECKTNIVIYEGERFQGGASTYEAQNRWPVEPEERYNNNEK